MKHYKCKHVDSRVQFVIRGVLTFHQFQTINIVALEACIVLSGRVKPTKCK